MDSLTDEQFNVRFEAFLADTISNEEARHTCRILPMAKKREMLTNHMNISSKTQRSSKFANYLPSDYIRYLRKEETKKNHENVYQCLESLRVDLKSKGVSWVQVFGQNSGLDAILDILRNIYRAHETKSAKSKTNYRQTTHSICIKCLQAFMNNTYGLQQMFDHTDALVLLAKSIDVNYPHVMMDAVKLMAALCLIPPNGHEKVLEALTICAEMQERDRFSQIIAGLRLTNNDPLVVSCMQLINALVSSVEDLDYKLHLRNELVRSGLSEIIDSFENARKLSEQKQHNQQVGHNQNRLKSLASETKTNGVLVKELTDAIQPPISYPLLLQTKIFCDAKYEDLEELYHRFENIKQSFDLNDPKDCFDLLGSSLAGTPSEASFLSILQHLLLIRDDPYARPAYYRLIEECLTQIVLHRSGLDPDFSYTKRFNIDVEYIIDHIVERAKIDQQTQSSSLMKKLEKALTVKGELEARLDDLLPKLKNIETENEQLSKALVQSKLVLEQQQQQIIQQKSTTVTTNGHENNGFTKGGVAQQHQQSDSSTLRSCPPPPPPPPPPPISFLPPLNGVAPPPPPPPPPTPPPPPNFGSAINGAPPPPGPPQPPPPPPLPGLMGPPPPPMPGFGTPLSSGIQGSQSQNSPDSLPFGLKPKRTWDLKTPLKRTNWKKISVHNLTEEAFWVQVDETKLDTSGEICEALASKFSSDPRSRIQKQDSQRRVESSANLKRSRELKVLDQKSAQNLMITLSSSKVSATDMTKYIITVDEEHLNAAALQQLIRYLPQPQQLNRLEEYRDQIDELHEAEQFALILGSIKRLEPRLTSIIFKLRFEEYVNDITPEIVAATTACEEIKKSKKLAKILKYVLLIGNVLNSGSTRGGAYGFEINFLPKLVATKAEDNKTTLLHFLADTVEKKAPDALDFYEEIHHVDRASRISPEQLQKSLEVMKRSIENLDKDLKIFKPHNSNDRFGKVMSSFLSQARERFQLLQKMFDKMEKLYKNLATYYAFEPKKYTMDEFFTDIKTFKDQFIGAHKENEKLREQEEKLRRATIEREKREQQKHTKKMQFDSNIAASGNGDGDADKGLMDNLMSRLETGAAFAQRPRRTRPGAGAAAAGVGGDARSLRVAQKTRALAYTREM